MLRLFHIQNRRGLKPASISLAPKSLTERIAPGTYLVVLSTLSGESATASVVIDNENSGTANFDNVRWATGGTLTGSIRTASNVVVAQIVAFVFTGSAQTCKYTSVFVPEIFPGFDIDFTYQSSWQEVRPGDNVTQWMISPGYASWLKLTDSSDAGSPISNSTWYSDPYFSINALRNIVTSPRSTTISLSCKNSYGKQTSITIKITQEAGDGSIMPSGPSQTDI